MYIYVYEAHACITKNILQRCMNPECSYLVHSNPDIAEGAFLRWGPACMLHITMKLHFCTWASTCCTPLRQLPTQMYLFYHTSHYYYCIIY